jgi:hypothetical protein
MNATVTCSRVNQAVRTRGSLAVSSVGANRLAPHVRYGQVSQTEASNDGLAIRVARSFAVTPNCR